MMSSISLNLLGSGTLALVGSGEYLDPIAPVDQWLMGCLGEPARVICLPTAAGNEGEERISYWSNLGIQHFKRLGAARAEALRVIDHPSAQDPAMAERISGANFIYLSGGKPTYLHATLQGTPVWEAILGVLSRGGVVAGCSAGAMIFGERIPTSLFSSSWQPAFNILSGAVIMPHFDEIPRMMMPGIRLLAGSLSIVGIEGSTALVCNQQSLSVQGKGSVVLVQSGTEQSYSAGQTI